jgi:hypothetical protein
LQRRQRSTKRKGQVRFAAQWRFEMVRLVSFGRHVVCERQGQPDLVSLEVGRQRR